ncbi:MAG TPA: ATP-binding protein [Solirubrobacterales bacterium]|nr:ATP-binding protein [Solirubrobacterales bacterium]
MLSVTSIPEALDELPPEPGFVVLMCGVAGSGKTTFSQQLAARGFARISIDEMIWNSAGRYGLDYPPEAYGEKVSAAREALKLEVLKLLARRQSVVVDSAFWNRAHRQSFAALVASNGGHHRIVYLKASKATLQARLEKRRSRFDANAALPIDDDLLERFLETFEEPDAAERPLVVLV